MQSYLPYNPQSTIRVEEQIQVADNKAFLRHIPKEGSIQIDGFAETDNPDPASGQFFCDYATDTLYRDANRIIHFGSVDSAALTVSYIAIGTVITADDMNEIKAHMENAAIHKAIDAWQYKGKFNNRPDYSDEDDTDIAIYHQCEDNDTFPDGSAPEVGYYSLQDIPFTYYDMAFHNDDLLFYLPLANGSKKWFVMQSAANYLDYYTYRHPTILPDYPARGTENTNDKHPPEGNLWFDEDGKLHLAGKDYNLYTFTPDPPANLLATNLSLTERDRKLLDYLHSKFDDQLG